jgi:TonB family protein
MKQILTLAVAFGLCAFGESAWEREMSAGNAALVPKTAKKAEQHFRAAVSAASSPVEKASALTRLGLVLHRLLNRNPSEEYLTTTVEPLYVEAIALTSQKTADHALALELYSMLLTRTKRADEAAGRWVSASAIRKAIVAAAADDSVPPGSRAEGGERIGDGVSAPNLVSKVEPDYTVEARVMKHHGTAVLYVVVGKDGRPHNVRLVRGLGLGLDEEAVEAILQWKFQPGMKDGELVNVSAQVEVNFRLL